MSIFISVNNAVVSRCAAQGRSRYVDLQHEETNERNGKVQRPTLVRAQNCTSHMSLLLCYIIVTVQCFIWCLGFF